MKCLQKRNEVKNKNWKISTLEERRRRRRISGCCWSCQCGGERERWCSDWEKFPLSWVSRFFSFRLYFSATNTQYSLNLWNSLDSYINLRRIFRVIFFFLLPHIIDYLRSSVESTKTAFQATTTTLEVLDLCDHSVRFHAILDAFKMDFYSLWRRRATTSVVTSEVGWWTVHTD